MLRIINPIITFIKRFKLNYIYRKELLHRAGIRSYIFNSSGYVIIIVLIITTLLISITGEFIIISQTNIGYIRKINSRIKASFLAKSGIEIGKYILKADRRGLASSIFPGLSTNKKIDCYNDLWALNFPELPMGDGTLKLIISDENSKINLSILANDYVEKTPYYGITQRFFLNMGLSMDLADVIIDWVDIDDSRFPYGAESSDYYQTLSPPYSAKNSAMDSIDELLMLKEITPEIYYGLGGGNHGLEDNLIENNNGNIMLDLDKLDEILEGSQETKKNELLMSDTEIIPGREKSRKLSDYFRVNGNRNDYLNKHNKININTASYRVISALTDNMTDDIVSEIINRRISQPFDSINQISAFIDDETIRKNILTVKSYIFKIKSIATINDTKVKITTIYNRDRRRFLYWCEE